VRKFTHRHGAKNMRTLSLTNFLKQIPYLESDSRWVNKISLLLSNLKFHWRVQTLLNILWRKTAFKLYTLFLGNQRQKEDTWSELEINNSPDRISEYRSTREFILKLLEKIICLNELRSTVHKICRNAGRQISRWIKQIIRIFMERKSQSEQPNIFLW
jgi:hypothetical protein